MNRKCTKTTVLNMLKLALVLGICVLIDMYVLLSQGIYPLHLTNQIPRYLLVHGIHSEQK